MFEIVDIEPIIEPIIYQLQRLSRTLGIVGTLVEPGETHRPRQFQRW